MVGFAKRVSRVEMGPFLRAMLASIAMGSLIDKKGRYSCV